MGCVHCLPVSSEYASANSWADWSVSDDVNGWLGLHHTSVDSPAPWSPRASTADGNSSALPTDATTGRKSCCRAWVQKLVKSGGMGTPVSSWAPASLNAEIWAEKSLVPLV